MDARSRDLFDVISRRWSCRSYLPDPIDQATLERILGAMNESPSAGNRQSWHAWVVRDPSVRRLLADASYGQMFVAAAPVVVVMCALPETSAERYGSRGRMLYTLQEAAAATQTLLLAAEAEGVASCWVGAFSETDAARALALPPDHRPVAIVTLGRPDGEARPTDKRPLSEGVSWVDSP